MAGLALFDFDGTITRKDSLLEFLKYKAGSFGFYKGMFLHLPDLFYFMLVKKEGWRAKRKVIRYFLGGYTKEEMLDLGKRFSSEVLPEIVEPTALEKIKWHQKEGHRVIIVSASLDIWLKPWTDNHGIELICTHLDYVNDQVTGKFANPNCNGLEKVIRIKALLNINDYEPIYAYGNSQGDMPMLNVADYKFYKYFF